MQQGKNRLEARLDHPNGFFGRDSVVDDIIYRLNGTSPYDSPQNIITVQGEPGLGKTGACADRLMIGG